MLVCILLSSLVVAGSVTRSIPATASGGDIVEITLTVATDTNDNMVVLTEVIPSGLIATPLGNQPFLMDIAPSGNLQKALTFPMLGQYKYNIAVPDNSAETYTFDGEYILHGGVPSVILGDTILTITAPIDDPCAGVTCQPTTETCPDGVEVSCENTCSADTCGTCTPDCSNNQIEDTCTSSIVDNGVVGVAPGCAITCNAGFTLTNGACVQDVATDLTITVETENQKTILQGILDVLKTNDSLLKKLSGIAKVLKENMSD